MTIVICWPRMMNPDMAMEYVDGQIFQDLVTNELVKARVQRKGGTRYDRIGLDNALGHWGGFDSE